jgi:hypothetical protein
LKRFEVKVGNLYKAKVNGDSRFLEGEVFRITSINDDEVEYTYLSDSWTSSKNLANFTDNQLELPTKLEMYVFGATNVEMD